MNSLQMLEILVSQSHQKNHDRLCRWIGCSYKAIQLPDHGILAFDIQSVGELDCVITALEGENARALSDHKSSVATMRARNLLHVLCNAWVSMGYEVMRTLKQRLKSDSDFHQKWGEPLEAIFRDLEKIRVQQFKREIAQGSKIKGKVELQRVGGGEETVEEYRHGETIMISPIAVRSTDGSFVWTVINVDLQKSEDLYRRDLADQMLVQLEALRSEPD